VKDLFATFRPRLFNKEVQVSFFQFSLPLLGWTLVFVYLAYHLMTLTKIQDVYGDEAAVMQTSLTLLKTGQVGSYSGREVFSPPFTFLTNAFPYAIRPFVYRYYGLFIRFFGHSLATARFASWLAGAIGVIFLYALALRFMGSVGGLASLIVLLSDPILGTSLHICREELPLFAAQALVGVLWARAFTKNSFWVAVLAGLGAGLAPGLHTNAILLTPALGAMSLLMHDSSKGWVRAVSGLSLGLVCGLTVWVISCPWDEFILGWKIWGGYWGYGMPILSGQSLLSMLGAEIARYLHPSAIPQSVPTATYAWALHTEYAVVGLSLVLAIWHARKERVEAVLVTGLLTVIFGMSLIVARKYAGYSLLTLPWMALLVGLAVSRHKEWMTTACSKERARFWRGGLAMVGIVLLLLGTKAVTAQAMNPLPYIRVCQDLEHWIPAGSRVLGPGQFWLNLPGRDWRDSNFLIFEKWLTNSSRHVGPALDRIRPDFIVVDDALNRLLGHYAQRGLSPHIRAGGARSRPRTREGTSALKSPRHT
jgi:4-amino-4-deoxy-L-arabinose transferase-like glycosyltransferase